MELFLLCPQHGYTLNLLKFRFQVIKEERIDDFVNILYTRVMHAAGASGFRVQSALKNIAEDGGADL